MNTSRYARPARLLHWLMAVLLLLTIPAGLIMVRPEVGRELQNALFIFHKNVGVLLLLLIVLRLAVRRRHPPPAKPASLPAWQARVASLTQGALYLLLVVQPVAGYVRVRAGGFPIEALDAMGIGTLLAESDALAEAAKAVHHWAGLAIVALAALHIGAALFHLTVKRDGVFWRMWPPAGGPPR
ncbi:cytochrome b [Pseudohaliea rubra]|uniref:Cytochrome B561 n=1 Tax=Pseudohaliea rubra DSM 19751 TaxID=1265313 RepID=A0A095VMF5_9GAMM|nr:cytochrome b/b6 domain-containing protein [Pseudohaliea rubra]KGE02627.1 cytochrome B561 [Pseudohaliea rubra DSM 19751]